MCGMSGTDRQVQDQRLRSRLRAATSRLFLDGTTENMSAGSQRNIRPGQQFCDTDLWSDSRRLCLFCWCSGPLWPLTFRRSAPRWTNKTFPECLSHKYVYMCLFMYMCLWFKSTPFLKCRILTRKQSNCCTSTACCPQRFTLFPVIASTSGKYSFRLVCCKIKAETKTKNSFYFQNTILSTSND